MLLFSKALICLSLLTNFQFLEISGELTYRERMAVPPQSTAIVELNDVTDINAPTIIIAQQKIEMAGQQVPVRFRLTVDQTKLTVGRRYSVRGAIVDLNQQVLWTTTEGRLIDPMSARAELGTLVMFRGSLQNPGPDVNRPEASGGIFVAAGNEPGWKVEISDKQITLLTNYGNTRVVAPRTAPELIGDTTRYVSTVDGRQLTATIVNRTCTDTMTGTPYPNTVVVVFNGREFRGCGGNPADLLQATEWVIEEMSGIVIADGSNGTLSFTPDGMVSGRSFCNSYRGRYTLTGEGLSIGLSASTLIGCANELMDQEKLFTNLLANVRRFEMGAGGSLILHAGDGRTIKARRR